MPLYMPISIKGEGVDLSVLAPFVIEPPKVNIGTWLTTKEYLEYKYPTVTVTAQNEALHFAHLSSLEMAFRIPQDQLEAFNSSQAEVTIIGDVEDNYFLWIETTSQSELFRIVSNTIVPKAGVAKPKIRLIVHNTTRAYLASDWIELVDLETAEVTSMTDEVYDKEHPVLIDSPDQPVLIKIHGNAMINELKRWNDVPNFPYFDALPYQTRIVSINLVGNVYEYVCEIYPSGDQSYGVGTLAGVNYLNRNVPDAVFTIVSVLRTHDEIYFTPSSSFSSLAYRTRGNISYNVEAQSPVGVEIPTATTLTKLSDTEYNVVIKTHTLSRTHPTVVNIPFSDSSTVSTQAITQSQNALKDMVIGTYDYLNEENEVISTHQFTWLDLANYLTGNVAMLSVPVIQLPRKVVIRYDLNGTGESTLTFNMLSTVLSVIRAETNPFGHLYHVKTLLIREPLNIIITPKDPDNPVNEHVIFVPGSPVPVTRQSTFPIVINERQHPIQEILDDIRL